MDEITNQHEVHAAMKRVETWLKDAAVEMERIAYNGYTNALRGYGGDNFQRQLREAVRCTETALLWAGAELPYDDYEVSA